MRVLGEEVFGSCVEVGEVAAASAGDEDFFAGAVGVVDKEDAAPAASSLEGAHEAGGTCSEDDCVVDGVVGLGGEGHEFDCRRGRAEGQL